MDLDVLLAKQDGVFEKVLQDLKDLVRIPSVSAASFDPAQMERSAAFVAQALENRGCRAKVVTATDPRTGQVSRPAILASKAGPVGAPTVLLYAHHDVQPPGDESLWDTPPFVPTERNGRLYGRGSADDGAGIAVHLGTLDMWEADLPVNLKIFIEGEEEVGSPTFRPFLEQYREELTADVIVVADSGNWQVGEPALTAGLRGVIDCVVKVKVLDHAVHSGFFGGPIIDSVTCLSRLIASLHDAEGSVAVPGLVREESAEVDYSEADLRSQAGAVPGLQLAGRGDLAARMWNQPAISVIGFDATSVEKSSNTIIPWAQAKISMRIAPGQDPRAAYEALRDHLLANAPFGAQVEVIEGELGNPYRANLDSPAVKAVTWALTEGFCHPSVNIGQGGSIPFIADLVEVFPQAEVLVTGVEDPHSQAHSENESMDLGDLRKAVMSQTLLLGRLAGVF